MPALTVDQQRAAERLLDLAGPLRLRYCPLEPTTAQEAFLRLRQREVLYGGAAGGGKTLAMLMAGLQYCDVPGYNALLLRPSMPEFELPGGLIELSHDWLASTKAVWSTAMKIWRFPGSGRSGAGGASLRFGYLDGVKDVHRYAGSSFSFVGYDELVRFEEPQYRRMFRVLRQPQEEAKAMQGAPDGTRLRNVPVRVRATSNPGGPGHAWVKSYFYDPDTRRDGALYLPCRPGDNPFLDQEEYDASLAALPLSERERLRNGDWNIPDEGELFQRDWFQPIERDQLPARTRAVRYWDLAATEPSIAAPDPDYTVGLRLELDDRDGIYFVTDIVRVRRAAGAVEQLVAATAVSDGRAVAIVIEEEPGAAGRAVTDRFKKHVLRGYAVRSVRPTGSKLVRARVVAAAAENRLIRVVDGRNVRDFLDEVSAFPYGPHDDCVDALAGAHQALTCKTGGMRVAVPRGRIPGVHDDRLDPYRSVFGEPWPRRPW